MQVVVPTLVMRDPEIVMTEVPAGMRLDRSSELASPLLLVEVEETPSEMIDPVDVLMMVDTLAEVAVVKEGMTFGDSVMGTTLDEVGHVTEASQ